MHALHVICLLIAAVCFLVAAFGATSSRVNLVALGLLAWVIVPLSDVLNT